MPVTTTYPGVYIQELPSGVHTITGVATSIMAFLGYTARGPVNEPVHIFSNADFERAFGGVTANSPLSHAVRHFYDNGGTEAYVVRVASNARSASVALKDPAGNTVLTLGAASEGTWGNNLRVDISYDSSDPVNLFNLAAIELVDQNGALVPGRSEVFRNLSMDNQHPSYVGSVVNGRSDLLTITRPNGLAYVAATSTSGTLTQAILGGLPSPTYRVAFMLNRMGPIEVTVTNTVPAAGTLNDQLDAAAADLNTAMVGVDVARSGSTLAATVNDGTAAEHTSLHFLDAATNSMTATLKLGTANGGTELEGTQARRPAQTGVLSDGGLSVDAIGTLNVELLSGNQSIRTMPLPLWNPPAGKAAPTSLAEVVSLLNAAFGEAGRTEARLAGTTAMLVGGRLRILPPSLTPTTVLKFSGGVAAALKLTDANTTRNVAAYAPGSPVTFGSQVAGVVGNDGLPPAETDVIGNEAARSGIRALDSVDLFNLMVIPDASVGPGMPAAFASALAYCERRRAFLIMDTPEGLDFGDTKTWVDSWSAPLRGRNGALFFPRLRMPNPQNPSVIATYGAAGALAGVFARTDAERGVWKAPAGTGATIRGASGLSYKMTDAENGVLNPLGINCLRTFPVYGTVNWGARTGRGADALADEYKYIPVRRLALFLEESLFRGTQWVVFEPNDEPLWAQIRLNLGAFMHGLYAQGAFQGRTPRDAYFVRCDSETTTQNDRDLGRVNIVVGFAPLKPAEFVVITIQQIAGNILT